MREADLIAAYGARTPDMCVCGGRVEASLSDSWPVVAAAIRLHNLTRRHQDWRDLYEIGPRPTPVLPSGDLFPAEDGLSVGVPV